MENEYHGMYRAVVCDNNDPERRGRIRVQCPAVLGNYLSAWCEPCIPYATDYAGDYYVPPLGEGIWVQFENGDVDKPIWNGGWYKENSSPLPTSADPFDFRFITFKNSVLRMGEQEFVFELRNGDESAVLTINLETWKGLYYISTYDEAKIKDLDDLVINADWILHKRPEEENAMFEELSNLIKDLGDAYNSFTQDIFPETINQVFTEIDRTREIAHQELEDVVEQLNEQIGDVSGETSDIRDFLETFKEVFNSNVEKLNRTLTMIDEAEILPEETEKLDTI